MNCCSRFRVQVESCQGKSKPRNRSYYNSHSSSDSKLPNCNLYYPCLPFWMGVFYRLRFRGCD